MLFLKSEFDIEHIFNPLFFGTGHSSLFGLLCLVASTFAVKDNNSFDKGKTDVLSGQWLVATVVGVATTTGNGGTGCDGKCRKNCHWRKHRLHYDELWNHRLHSHWHWFIIFTFRHRKHWNHLRLNFTQPNLIVYFANF